MKEGLNYLDILLKLDHFLIDELQLTNEEKLAVLETYKQNLIDAGIKALRAG